VVGIIKITSFMVGIKFAAGN